MSILYSVLYLARFHSLRHLERGLSWVFVSGSCSCVLSVPISDTNLFPNKAAAQPHTSPYWNMWLFLALPAVWLTWSLVFFTASLLSFVWTSGDRRVPDLTPFTDEDRTMGFLPMSLRDFTPLWPRIILTVVLTFGLGVGLLVMKAFRDIGASTWQRPKSKKSKKSKKSNRYNPDSTSSSSSSSSSSSDDEV